MNHANQFVDLDKTIHDRGRFDCGEKELNRFLKECAAQHMIKNLSITRVLPLLQQNDDGKYPICAFYTVAPCSVKRDGFAPQLSKKLPRYPIPAFLLAQLAVDSTYHGTGMGKLTLTMALKQLWHTNKTMRGYVVIVDCLNNDVVQFYERFGFEHFRNEQERIRMYILMRTLDKLFKN